VVRAEPGRYKLRVTFEPSDWSLHPPSRGRVRGSFTMQLAISPSPKVGSEAGSKECEQTTLQLEAKQGSGPFHLFTPNAAFSRDPQTQQRSGLLKAVPLHTSEESMVRVSVRFDFESLPLYTILSSRSTARKHSGEQASREQDSGAVLSRGMGNKTDKAVQGGSWVCMPGYNSCQLVAVVPAGDYDLAFYQPFTMSLSSGDTGDTCVEFGLRIQMHPTRLKYGLACHGARELPADLSRSVHVSTTTHSSGARTHRASLRWADDSMLVPEADAGQLQVQDTVLITLPSESGNDAHQSYLLHVRHRDGRPYSRIQIAPYTNVRDTARRQPPSEILTGSEGGWETLSTSSHLAIDQEALFLYKGHKSKASPGAEVTLGLRVTWTVAHWHEACPTWALAVNVQNEGFVRRASTCPPGAGQSLPSTDLAVNAAGYGWEELDTWAPLSAWPPSDSSCAQQEQREVESGARPCGHTADTSFHVSRPSLLQASLGFDAMLASYTLALISVSANADTSSVIASSLPVFHSHGDPREDGARPGAETSPPLSTLSRVSLSQELPEGKYVVRIVRKHTLAETLSQSATQALEMCTPLRWRIAVSPLGQGPNGEVGQRPFVLDVDPPGLHNVPKTLPEIRLRLLLSEPLGAGQPARGMHVCPKGSVPADAWLQDSAGGGGGKVSAGGGSGCFEVSWVHEVAQDGQEAEGEARGWEVQVGVPTVNMQRGQQYVLWFKGSQWPRGAISGRRLLQPPPFSLSVTADECGGHGVLASDGMCECHADRAGFLCSACDPSVAVRDCTLDAVPDQEARGGAAAPAAPTKATTPPKSPTSPAPAAPQASAPRAAPAPAAPVPGFVGGRNGTKYSMRIRDDGAVDADTVVDLDDSEEMAKQKRQSAAAAAKVAKEKVGDDKSSGQASSSSPSEPAVADSSKNIQKHHIVCSLIGCGKKSAWALAGVSVVLGVLGFLIGVVTCMYKRRRRGVVSSQLSSLRSPRAGPRSWWWWGGGGGYARVRFDDDL